MPDRPNVLFLMVDQMQGRVLDPAHPCQAPSLRRLADRGVRFRRAVSTNAVCSPARAGIMTGLLPHSHGVLAVTHTVDDDQCVLRTDRPHWAQHLRAAGYRTGYFGQWHVERSGELERFGWDTHALLGSPQWRERHAALRQSIRADDGYVLERHLSGMPGYKPGLFYGVTRTPPEQRAMGVTTSLAEDFLRAQTGGDDPWCCFVSIVEPHDPYVCGTEAFARYDPDSIELSENVRDPMLDKPGLYRKAARVFAEVTDDDRRHALACYWASITELDALYGRLLDLLDETGQADNTIVVLTGDHGDFMGAHGLYQKNVGAFDEAYNIPLLVAGPGVATGVTTDARVSSHSLAPTLCELTGSEPLETGQSRSFAPVLRDPTCAADYTTAYAEYFGTRYSLTQRVLWRGPWKLVWNGFDDDELYNLEDDPGELRNRINDPAAGAVLREMMAEAWRIVRDTNDHTLWKATYASLRLAPFGQEILD